MGGSCGTIAVHEAIAGDIRVEYVVFEGEPYAHGIVGLRGLWAAMAFNDGAVMLVGEDPHSEPFVRVAWLADVESDVAKREMLGELRRRLLALHEATEGSPDGESVLTFESRP